jgi:hypothetical protein
MWAMEPTTGPAEDLFTHPEVLERFVAEVRSYFTGLEGTHKHMKKLHLFGALPLSAAVALGRCLKSRELRPDVALYDRTNDGYSFALEV